MMANTKDVSPSGIPNYCINTQGDTGTLKKEQGQDVIDSCSGD